MHLAPCGTSAQRSSHCCCENPAIKTCFWKQKDLYKGLKKINLRDELQFDMCGKLKRCCFHQKLRKGCTPPTEGILGVHYSSRLTTGDVAFPKRNRRQVGASWIPQGWKLYKWVETTTGIGGFSSFYSEYRRKGYSLEIQCHWNWQKG